MRPGRCSVGANESAGDGMNCSIQTELKAVCEGIGRILLYLQDGEPDTEELRKVMLAVQHSYDLRAVAERYGIRQRVCSLSSVCRLD